MSFMNLPEGENNHPRDSQLPFVTLAYSFLKNVKEI
jgi:hypothetical protein